MSRRFLVQRGRSRALVPVGGSLWSQSSPVTEDRILFHPQPFPYHGNGEIEGDVSGHGRWWQLMDVEIDESWSDGETGYRRYRAALVDPSDWMTWGDLYWTRRGRGRRRR